MATMSALKWPYDDRSFALAVDRLAKEGNSLASKFYVSDGPLGRKSHEFREIRTLLHASLLISYDSVDNDYFNVRVGGRVAKVLFERAEATEDEKKEAVAILQAHLEEYSKSRRMS